MNAHLQIMEHRWGTRVQRNEPGKLQGPDGRTFDIVVVNSSLSGAFVQTTARLALLARVRLQISDGSQEWVPACVVRHESGGMGLEWVV